MVSPYEILGVIGFVFIILAQIMKNRKEEHIFFIIGGIFLEIYSIHLGNVIFIMLQIVFIVVASYWLFKHFKK